jgi:hypothetical protein
MLHDGNPSVACGFVLISGCLPNVHGCVGSLSSYWVEVGQDIAMHKAVDQLLSFSATLFRSLPLSTLTGSHTQGDELHSTAEAFSCSVVIDRLIHCG